MSVTRKPHSKLAVQFPAGLARLIEVALWTSGCLMARFVPGPQIPKGKQRPGLDALPYYRGILAVPAARCHPGRIRVGLLYPRRRGDQ